jgi:hypothetical protein
MAKLFSQGDGGKNIHGSVVASGLLWNDDTVAHADCKGKCRRVHRKLGKYVVTRIENKRKCISVQRNAR